MSRLSENGTHTWNAAGYAQDDLLCSDGLLLFCLQHACGVGWQRTREERAWLVFDAFIVMFSAARPSDIDPSDRDSIYHITDGISPLLTTRRISKRFVLWAASEISCCYCVWRARVNQVAFCIEYPVEAPRPPSVCRCFHPSRHPKCSRCEAQEEQADEAARAADQAALARAPFWASQILDGNGDSD